MLACNVTPEQIRTATAQTFSVNASGRLFVHATTYRGLSAFFVIRLGAEGPTVLGAYVYRRKGNRDFWRLVRTYDGPKDWLS